MKIEKTITRNILTGMLLVILIFTSNFGFSQSDQIKPKDSLSFNYKFNASMRMSKGRLNQLMIPLLLQTTLTKKTFEIDLIGNYIYHKINGFQLENDILTRGVFTLFPQRRIHPVIGSTNLERIKAASKAISITLSTEDWFKLLEASQGHEVP